MRFMTVRILWKEWVQEVLAKEGIKYQRNYSSSVRLEPHDEIPEGLRAAGFTLQQYSHVRNPSPIESA